MIASLSKAFAQSCDARFLKIVLFGIGGAVLAYVLLFSAISWALATITLFDTVWLDWSTKILGGMTALVLSAFLFPSVVTLVICFFLDDIIDAVEAKYYPYLEPARKQSWAEIIAFSVRMTGLAVLLNLLFLPVYFIPVLNIAVFFLLNSYLLGWEYYGMVAIRRMEPREVKKSYDSHKKYLWGVGAVITLLLTLPIVSMLMPVIVVAFMTHIFQSLRSSSPSV